MTQKVDVKATRRQSVGSIDPGGPRPARLRQLQVKSATSGTPRITLKDGQGGPTLLDITFTPTDTHSVNIPGNGIRFENDIYVHSKANINAMTFFTS
jgi:hypothetical protein